MIHDKIFDILIIYSKIWKLSQNIDSSIANIAYKKMQYVIVELVHKFDGLLYLIQKIDTIEDEDLLILLGWMLIINDKNISKKIFNRLLESKSENIVFKADYCLKNIDDPAELNSIKKIIDSNLKKINKQ